MLPEVRGREPDEIPAEEIREGRKCTVEFHDLRRDPESEPYSRMAVSYLEWP